MIYENYIYNIKKELQVSKKTCSSFFYKAFQSLNKVHFDDVYL